MIKNKFEYILIEEMNFKDFNKSNNIKKIYIDAGNLNMYIDIINIIMKELYGVENLYNDKNIDACLDLASDVFVYDKISNEIGCQIFIKNLNNSNLDVKLLEKIFYELVFSSQNLHFLYELEVDRNLDIYIFKENVNFDELNDNITKQYDYIYE
ncbi:MAG: hypothetical protein ACK5HR_00745 [Mycoplasmatales bacterium]